MRMTQKIMILLSFSMLSTNAWAQYYDVFTGVYDGKLNVFYYDGLSHNQWTKQQVKKDLNVVYKHDFANKKDVVFYTGKNQVKMVRLSPDLASVSFIEELPGRSVLVIADVTGKVQFKIDEQVQQYVWGKDSKSIYFISGVMGYDPESMVKLEPSGVWIYDLRNRNKIKIADKGWQIRNTLFDENIYYFNGRETVRLNVRNMTIENVGNKHIINLSPNKRYYFYYEDSTADESWEPPFYSPFRIFDTKLGEKLTAEQIGLISEKNPGDVIWSSDSNRIIFQGNKSRTDMSRDIFIFDIEKQKIVNTYPGVIVGLNNERTKLVVFKDGVFSVKPL